MANHRRVGIALAAVGAVVRVRVSEDDPDEARIEAVVG